MPTTLYILLLLFFIFAFCLAENGVYAFGAGNIPSYAYMEGKAFRHGDIEDALADLVKKAGGGLAMGLLGKSKFNGLDIKRVYFGNWLRDYSQAVDIAGLSKLDLQTIINLCMALGFLAHGYATGEFEVTVERLGCYLPTEHIDNPKGYGDGDDPKKYDSRLRGPVNPQELEVDPRTGMKNYIANEGGNWDTSKALVRRTLEKCIQLGRQNRARANKPDEYESLRLLGSALHTLEDFSAHSNFTELALVKLGYTDVFTHVGDHVRIQAPDGQWVAPLITGTFGSSDFIHSLLGEATDHISEASVSDLNKELDKARASQSRGPGGSSGNPADILRDLLFKLPGGQGQEMSREMEGVERIRAGQTPGGKTPEQMSPQELHAVLWQVLTFRDSVVKKISKTIEKIPGLGPLIEKLMDSISVFVFTTLEPFLKPILKTASSGLQTASGEVIDSHDQYEVFNDPRASDPTHSFLSKDHFNLILNEPAGLLSKIIVVHAVQLIVRAWDDNSMNVHHVTSDILECLFHPNFHDPKSTIQRQMMQFMSDWVNGLGSKKNDIIRRLSKSSVREHANIRLAGEGGESAAVGSYAYNQGVATQSKISNYTSQIPGFSQAQSVYNQFSGGQGNRRDSPAGGSSGYPGASHSQPQQQHASNTPTSGEAASFFSSGNNNSSHTGYGQHQPSHPSGGYAPPSGYPPSNTPSYPSTPAHAGYSPSYASPPPSFPGASPPAFPDPGFGGGHQGGYAPYPGGPAPGFPGGGGAPGFPSPGGPPSFPGADPYGSSAPQFPNAPHHGGHHNYQPPGGPYYG